MRSVSPGLVLTGRPWGKRNHRRTRSPCRSRSADRPHRRGESRRSAARGTTASSPVCSYLEGPLMSARCWRRSNGRSTPRRTSLGGSRRLIDFLTGAGVERTNSQLDSVETDLLRLMPDPYLRGQLPNLVAHVRDHLPEGDPRRIGGRDGRGGGQGTAAQHPTARPRARSGGRCGQGGQPGGATFDQARAQLPEPAARVRADPQPVRGRHHPARRARTGEDPAVLHARDRRQRERGLPDGDAQRESPGPAPTRRPNRSWTRRCGRPRTPGTCR